MTNNDILRRLRYILDLNDKAMISIFTQAGSDQSREQVSQFLKKDDDADYQSLSDNQLAIFLNGLINHKRGKKEGDQPVAEDKLNNNIILRKLKIAFDLQADDILALLESANLRLSKHELSAFFRKADHKHYRECKDQVLRNFLQGLQAKLRPRQDDDSEEEFSWPELDK